MGYSPLSHNSQHQRDASSSESVFDAKTDVALAAEAAQFLTVRPAIQLVAEFLTIIRGDGDAEYQATIQKAKSNKQPMPPYLAWWSLHDRYDSYTVMGWFKQRPDIRQAILTRMCDFPAKAGRLMDPSTQASLIEMVVQSGDRTAADFDAAVRPEDIVVYGQADDVFRQFADSFPKERLVDSAQHERTLHILSEVLTLFVEGKKSTSGALLTPILSHLDFRLALGVEEWRRFIPMNLQVRVDNKRIIAERNRSNGLLTTRDEIREVGINNIVKSFAFDAIRKVFEVASNRVRFDIPATERTPSSITAPSVKRELSNRLPLPKNDSPIADPLPQVPQPAEARETVSDLPLLVDPLPSAGETIKSIPPPPTTEVDEGWDQSGAGTDAVTLGPPPPPAEQHTGVELAARDAAYIPDEMFASAQNNAVSASTPPVAKRSGSTSDLRVMQLLIEMHDVYGLKFPNGGMYFPPELTRDIYSVMTQREWIEDDQRMRVVMVNILHTLDPADYTLNGEWANAPLKPLTTMFISNLRDAGQPILMDVAKSLEEKRKP